MPLLQSEFVAGSSRLVLEKLDGWHDSGKKSERVIFNRWEGVGDK